MKASKGQKIQAIGIFVLILVAMTYGVSRTITILYNVIWWKSLMIAFGIEIPITLFWIWLGKIDKENEKTKKEKRI